MAYPHVTIPEVVLTPAEAARRRARISTWVAFLFLLAAAPMPFMENEFPAIGVGGLALFLYGMAALAPQVVVSSEKAGLVLCHMAYAYFWFLPCVGALVAAVVAWRRTRAEARSWSRAAFTLVVANGVLLVYVSVMYVWYVVLRG